MPDIQEFLSTKRLGAPTWVWATAVVALGSGIVLYVRQKKSGNSTTPDGGDSSTGSGVDDSSTTAGGVGTGITGFPVPFGGGDVIFNNPPSPPATTPDSNAPDVPTSIANRQLGTYVVKGVPAYKVQTNLAGPQGTTVTDEYPGGVAAIVYGLSGGTLTNAKALPDEINIAMDALEIEMLNPTIVPPYAVGTKLTYVVHPEKIATPAPQVSSTTTSPTPTTASGT